MPDPSAFMAQGLAFLDPIFLTLKLGKRNMDVIVEYINKASPLIKI